MRERGEWFRIIDDLPLAFLPPKVHPINNFESFPKKIESKGRFKPTKTSCFVIAKTKPIYITSQTHKKLSIPNKKGEREKKESIIPCSEEDRRQQNNKLGIQLPIIWRNLVGFL